MKNDVKEQSRRKFWTVLLFVVFYNDNSNGSPFIFFKYRIILFKSSPIYFNSEYFNYHQPIEQKLQGLWHPW